MNTSAANNEANWYLRKAEQDIRNLSAFSGILQEEAKRSIEAQKDQGRAIHEQNELERAENIIRLNEELAIAKQEQINHEYLSSELLELEGPRGYPDAQRISNLGRYQQYGFLQARLKMMNQRIPTLLQKRMMESENLYNLNGYEFTLKNLDQLVKDGKILRQQAAHIQAAAIRVEVEALKKDLGLDEFTDELLNLAGTNEVFDKSLQAYLNDNWDKANKESSLQKKAQAQTVWENSNKTGEDLQLYLASVAATLNKEGGITGRSGAWDHVMSTIASTATSTTQADIIGNLPLPDTMAVSLGVPKGTTYAQQWPQRFSALKTAIKKNHIARTDLELKYQQADGKALQAQFIAEGRRGPMSEDRVNQYKRAFGALGLPIPSGVTNYETLMDRNIREDKDEIRALVAANGGIVTHQMLDRFHPEAALEWREKATKFDESSLSVHDAEKKIKAELDKTFHDMGIKSNEKSPAYVEAFANAKADYKRKFNNYIGMGYSREEAAHLALRADSVKNKETGEIIPNSKGVITEIQTGPGNKYTVIGQAIEKELKPGHIRVARIASGKQEIQNDPNIIFNGTIGGDYGRRQLETIIENISKHGTEQGINMSPSATAYYQGLARGRDGNWRGLIDAQLKAIGHEGLWPTERPVEQNLFAARTEDNQPVEDPRGSLVVAKHVERASKFPSPNTYYYTHNLMKDQGDNSLNNPYSVWDEDINKPSWWGLYTAGGLV
jgi:hypothetical protein